MMTDEAGGEEIVRNGTQDGAADASRKDGDDGAAPLREQAQAMTVVGLGASAGGIQALQEFFGGAPADSGMAFVVVLHLSPEYESRLAEVLGRMTAMPVQQVTEPVRLEPDHVYAIPPSHLLESEDGMLRLVASERPRGGRAEIDQFFRSMADAHGPQSVAVVLSGTGSDGALGLRHVKEVGGLTIVQEPEGAEHDAMPRHAIATGVVDYVLPARDMARQIITYRDASRRMRLPHEAAPSPDQREDGPEAEAALGQILAHVRSQTGHDFSYYKRATVLRRIGRRLQVHNQPDLPAYLALLRRHPAEVKALLGDLLISVTQFFRDRPTWEALEREVIPRLFDGKGPEDEVRAWVCGCATGEEAYSLAILLLERAARMERPPRVQVFATDMSADAISFAREGSYPETIDADVSPERMRRWFHAEQGRCRVRKELREAVLFALHDVLKDTPFSRLDLVTCRNLLIYLNQDAQGRVFEVFHFALRPDGRLLLGGSEAVDGSSPLFAPVDKSHRIYVRRPLARPVLLGANAPGIRPLLVTAPRASEGGPLAAPLGREPRPVSAGELHRDLLELYAPPSVLVDEGYQMLHVSDSAGWFLRVVGGEPTADLLRALHPGLRLDVSTALYAAAGDGRDQTRIVRATLEPAGPVRVVRVVVRPVRVPAGASGYFLVLFEELPGEGVVAPEGVGDAPAASVGGAPPLPTDVRQLEQEIDRLQAQLRSTGEQYEASIEELKASNEELQAMNEEMRSATEELETGKEELQSLNEELSTVNQELKNRIDEVGRANADLQNLLVSTDIATLFLDRELRIKRYTPPAQELFNVIPSDSGRPLTHVTHRLDYADLVRDAEAVLQRLTPVEREIRSQDGGHYLARILPYRTLDDRIDGVVLTFVDVTERERAEAALRQTEERFRLLIEGARDYAMFLLDMDGRITFWSIGAERVFGWSEAEALGQKADFVFTPEDREGGEAETETRQAAADGSAPVRRWHVRKDGTRLWADGVLMRLEGARGFAKITRDATVEWRTQQALREAHGNLEVRVAERTESLTKTLAALEAALAEQRQSEAARRDLLRRLAEAEEEERRRLSRELHDQTGQHLTGLLLGLESLKASLPTASASAALVERLQQSAADLSRDVHQTAWDLRPPALDDVGLSATLLTYVQEWGERHNTPVDFHGQNLERERPAPEIENTLYRAVQEALTNIARHAGAGRVGVALERQGPDVLLIVEDDGAGFDADAALAAPERLGLRGMAERMDLLDGTLTVESVPGQGTTLIVRIPWVPLVQETPHA